MTPDTQNHPEANAEYCREKINALICKIDNRKLLNEIYRFVKYIYIKRT